MKKFFSVLLFVAAMVIVSSCCNIDGILGPVHTHQLTKVDAEPATFAHPGTKEYYKCTVADEPCGLYFADAKGENAIGDAAALQAWLKGEGLLPQSEPLTLKAVGGSNKVIIKKLGEPEPIDLLYSIDGSEWAQFEIDKEYNLTDGQAIQLVAGADGNKGTATNLKNRFGFVFDNDEAAGNIEASGNIMSLLSEDNTAELTVNCFLALFDNCKKLVKAPELPAKTLAINCYRYMFSGCSIEETPELPATELADSCYCFMFSECEKLKKVSALPATTMKTSCYLGMFQDCPALTEAPALPATKLAEKCYGQMFNKCSSLTKAPELPATTLANWCYVFMFQECTALTKAPELPATTLANKCYRQMFYGCSSLTEAPSLPATTLTESCYDGMFRGCSSLTKAPVLAATTLAEDSYYAMFYDCPNLNSVEANFTSWSDATAYWLGKVASTGTFKCPAALPELRGQHNIPDGWTIVRK